MLRIVNKKVYTEILFCISFLYTCKSRNIKGAKIMSIAFGSLTSNGYKTIAARKVETAGTIAQAPKLFSRVPETAGSVASSAGTSSSDTVVAFDKRYSSSPIILSSPSVIS